MASKAQLAKIDSLQGGLAKQFGPNAVMRASEMPPTMVVPSGSLALDVAMGVGGVPANRVIELIGSEGGGKTTLALLIMKQFITLNPNRFGLFLDFEHKLTTEWVEQLVGAETMQNIIYMSPESAEEGIDMYVAAMRSGDIQVSTWDSIGGAPSISSMSKSAEVRDVGGNANTIARMSRIAATFSAKYESLFIGTNQLRDTIGSKVPVAATASSPGGHAWRHACVARIELKRNGNKFSEKQNGEDIQVGYDIKARIFKNQLAPPHRSAVWNFYNVPSKIGPVGIDTGEECVRLAESVGVVEVTNGGMHHHPALPGGKIRGKDNFQGLVMADQALMNTITSEVMAVLNSDPSLVGSVAPIDIDQNELDIEAAQDRLSEPNMAGSAPPVGTKLNLSAKK